MSGHTRRYRAKLKQVLLFFGRSLASVKTLRSQNPCHRLLNGSIKSENHSWAC